MTPADKLKELREALEGATPGPWTTGLYGKDPCADECCIHGPDGKPIGEFTKRDNDAAAVVALRNAATALLDIAEAAERMLPSAALRRVATADLEAGLDRLVGW